MLKRDTSCRGRLLCRSLAVALVVTLWGSTAHAGYTHYWTWKSDPSPEALAACVAEMRRVIDARRDLVEVHDEAETFGQPIAINGLGDQGHEPFVFPSMWPPEMRRRLPADAAGMNFCKTAYKPYDEVVTALLIVARDHFPPETLAISSDGDWSDWSAGARLYSRVLGRRARDPRSRSALDILPDAAPRAGRSSWGWLGWLLLAVLVGVFWTPLCIAPGQWLQRLGRNAAAERAFRIAAHLSPPWNADVRVLALAGASNTAFFRGEARLAVQFARQATAVKPRTPLAEWVAWLSLANALGTMGELDEAEIAWRRTLDIAERTKLRQAHVAAAQAGLGWVLARKARFDEADPLIRAAETGGGEAMALSALAELHVVFGTWDEALAVLDRLLPRPPARRADLVARHRSAVGLTRARVLIEMDRLDEAETHLGRASVDAPPPSRVETGIRAQRAIIEARRGNGRKARALLAPLLAQRPGVEDDRGIWLSVTFAAARVCLALGEFAEGRLHIAAVLGARPDPYTVPRIHHLDGLCALGLGDRAAAMDCFRRAAASSPRLLAVRLAQEQLAREGAP